MYERIEGIQESRDNEDGEPGDTDAEIAGAFIICRGCFTSAKILVPGERADPLSDSRDLLLESLYRENDVLRLTAYDFRDLPLVYVNGRSSFIGDDGTWQIVLTRTDNHLDFGRFSETEVQRWTERVS